MAQAKRAKSTTWASPSGTYTDEGAEPSAYQMLVASQSDALSPQTVVEVNVPYKPIGKSMYTSLASHVCDDEGIGAPHQSFLASTRPTSPAHAMPCLEI